MGARHKLNSAYFNGCLLVAGIAGLVTGSWGVFLVALAITVAASCYVGNIRVNKCK